MVLHMKSTQVQQEFGEVMDQALSGSEVIVERYGSPRLAIINYHRYEQLLEAERQLLRERLQTVATAVSKRAAQLSEQEIDEMIERARQEVHERSSEK
jgi:TRAP-type C4-dicarboxylate transport system substrate-binding protein